MKHEVMKKFKDKYTKKIYLVGDEYVTKYKKRAEKLIGKGFIIYTGEGGFVESRET